MGAARHQRRSHYRQAAYAALLQYLITSYEEIRLARGADDATRALWQAAWGLTTQFRPDWLDQLLLLPAQSRRRPLKTSLVWRRPRSNR
jgi:hypothetical protein